MAKTADIHIVKHGPNGRPAAQVLVDPKTSIDRVSAAVLKVTRDAAILKAVGLRACPACISGFDIWIRHRFDRVLNVEIG
jgi:hypothetical protein